MWTWMKGFNTVDQNGNYGTQGVSDPLNLPGSRRGSAAWTDSGAREVLIVNEKTAKARHFTVGYDDAVVLECTPRV